MTKLYDQLIGLPWFRRESYAAAVALMADADKFPADYDAWVQRAEHREQKTRGEGVTTTRVYLDGDRLIEFVDWCRVRGKTLEGKHREAFARHVTALGTKANLALYDHPGFRHGAIRKGRKR